MQVFRMFFVQDLGIRLTMRRKRRSLLL